MAKQEYIEKNQQWLTDKANEPGVKSLDKGILYKVVKNGNPKGAMPNRGSVVTVHYVGKTINGKTFDSSRGGVAPAFRLRELIRAGLLPCSRCTSGTNGKSTFRPHKATVVSVSPASLAAPPSSSKSNCWGYPDRG